MAASSRTPRCFDTPAISSSVGSRRCACGIALVPGNGLITTDKRVRSPFRDKRPLGLCFGPVTALLDLTDKTAPCQPAYKLTRRPQIGLHERYRLAGCAKRNRQKPMSGSAHAGTRDPTARKAAPVRTRSLKPFGRAVRHRLRAIRRQIHPGGSSALTTLAAADQLEPA
jgi:hypothetical protein